jgi:hypothetical protein
MSPPEFDAVKATNDVLEKIRTAWYDGKPIVPIIGAGFSADSGYPILNSICRYLARFRYALREGLLLPFTDKSGINVAPKLQPLLQAITNKGCEEPFHYIEQFGWPNRFDLNQMVARHVCPVQADGLNTSHELIEEVITKQYNWLAKISTTARAAKHWEDNIKLGSECSEWDRWEVQGDWRRLVQFFTGHRKDYGDDLFAHFGFRRTPSPGHRYITLLTKLLSIKVIFTFNFDDLIEKALSLEGVPYRVYGMEHGRSLPSPRVVGEGLSVIKMHGSHHAILIDEELDHPLEPAYIDRFYDLAGHDALLLVLGFQATTADSKISSLSASAKGRGERLKFAGCILSPIRQSGNLLGIRTGVYLSARRTIRARSSVTCCIILAVGSRSPPTPIRATP